ncbi:M50 family metallopeptidase [Geodermatophilus obscurus]|uniref:Peptidase M50 n=1 Tax=Geodermatophilus obscurus (strain ATCC 25078 / DSM 43160 / JCM 3152 / CCUG 61914 / KCC A-0152 / KCTC 9177 / NBRC 13315 / NRRL B-3577 / G-20) TaxID=526225 RepID=D2SDX5_GEOOG|nr:site-2 protease family protein [Geodermatophilus obscurus]ADB76541.1 peptidase M50 [Geodermatophilus obscurus DSM 43160]
MLLTVLGIVAFAAGLLFSIAFHEYGHFFWARKFGMRVPQFMVGFGPTLFSRTRGETEYGIKAVPLGGYIRIVGMIPPAEENESTRATRMRSFIAEVRGAALDDVRPGDEGRVFYAKPWWQRVIVMFAGPFHNLVLAVLLFTVLLTVVGTSVLTTTVRDVPACVLPAGAVTALQDDACSVPLTPEGQTCEAGAAGCALPQQSPAAAAGLRSGDTIVAIGGRPLDPTAYDSWTAVQEAIRTSPGQPLDVTIERDGARQRLTVTPIPNTVYADPTDPTEGTTTAGYLGISPSVQLARQDAAAIPGYFGMIVTNAVERLVEIPERIPQLFRAAFLGEERDPNGPIGVVGVGRISGEVFAIPELTGTEKVSTFLQLLASINLVLFLFNLLPIYPLDGGHVAGALYEKARAVVARLRGRPDPGPFDIARLMPVAYLVAGLFVVLSGLLLIADIVNPITLQ